MAKARIERLATKRRWLSFSCSILFTLALVLALITILVWSSSAPALTLPTLGSQAQPTIAAGSTHSLALKADGSLWAWGNNYYGQLGDGTTSDRHFPIRIGAGTGWAAVAAGQEHSLGLGGGGTLWAWGVNQFGQLGDGTTSDRHFPTRIGTGTDWVAVAAGGKHSLALRSDGSLWAWGVNQYGQLGDGTTSDRHFPTQVLAGMKMPPTTTTTSSTTTSSTTTSSTTTSSTTSTTLPPGPGFPDVPAGHPYRDAIYYLSGQGIIAGFEDGTFRPEAFVTRQQFAKMIVKTLGYPVTGAEICPFTDVAAQMGTDPFYPSKYVAVCAANGITIGKTATTFAPYDDITRQQLITMVVRAANLPEPPPGFTPNFSPGQFSLDEHYLNARKAAHSGLLVGLPDVGPSYDFREPATRGECAQILYSLMKP